MASRSFVQWRAPPGRHEPRPLHGVWVDGGRDGSRGEWWVEAVPKRDFRPVFLVFQAAPRASAYVQPNQLAPLEDLRPLGCKS